MRINIKRVQQLSKQTSCLEILILLDTLDFFSGCKGNYKDAKKDNACGKKYRTKNRIIIIKKKWFRKVVVPISLS